MTTLALISTNSSTYRDAVTVRAGGPAVQYVPVYKHNQEDLLIMR
nr:hypothetical protein [Mycobacterium lepromatosis]